MIERVLVVTGTRAEFGLLRTTIDAIDRHPDLELRLVAGGAHLLGDPPTIEEVRRRFTVDAEVPMQIVGEIGRSADARALGRGVSGFAAVFDRLQPDWIVVLGDRIEAFAAASAASVAGIALAHIHGGDCAEGVADEAMRHATTKLAHVHFAATETSATRIARMGEEEASIHVVGSPAVDGIDAVPALAESRYRNLGSPRVLLLHHGAGLEAAEEDRWIDSVISGLREFSSVLAIRPNRDPGSERIEAALARADSIVVSDGLERDEFIGLLRRIDVLVGNSSAALIEGAVIGCPAVNLGPRQGGRERCGNVVDVLRPDPTAVRDAIRRAMAVECPADHPYGGGGVGERIASILARGRDRIVIRKRIAY